LEKQPKTNVWASVTERITPAVRFCCITATLELGKKSTSATTERRQTKPGALMKSCYHKSHGADACKKTNPETRDPTDKKMLPDNFFQQIVDSSPDLITVLDKQQRVTHINKAASSATGLTTRQARGRKCFQVFHDSHEPLVSCPFARLLKDGQVHQEKVFDKRLGTWFLIIVSPLYNLNGQLIGSIHSARDITSLKKSEQALRESEERYHQLSEATMEGVLLSKTMRILTTNRVLADMVGYDLEGLKGKNLFRFIAPRDRNRMIDYFRSGRIGTVEVMCLRKDNTVFPISAHTRRITHQGRSVFQTAIRDLTLVKQSEQTRIHHERMRGMLQMAGAVCHEINQPLMALMGYIDIVNATNGTQAATAKALSKIGEQADRIGKLTKKLARITQYKTKDYAGGEQIIDIDLAASG
jgi:PAS domain S-box-containing protein